MTTKIPSENKPTPAPKPEQHVPFDGNKSYTGHPPASPPRKPTNQPQKPSGSPSGTKPK